MKRTLVLWTLAALVLAPAVAQDAAPADSSSDFDASAAPSGTPAPAAVDWGTLTYSGDQTVTNRWGAYNPATRTGGSLDSTMSAEYKRGDVKLVAAALVRYNEFVPGETAAYWSPGPFRFGAGLQEFSWGVADKVNPTDTLNARDYRHEINAPRLVNPAASVDWYPVSWVSVEAVYEPWKVESKFPTDFAGTTQAGLNAKAAALLGSPLGSFVPGYSPTTSTAATRQDFNNPVYGGRVNFFLTGVDVSVSYLYDRDQYYTPQVALNHYTVPPGYLGASAVTLYAPGQVSMVYNPVQRFGLNVKTTVDRYGFWVESAYDHTSASSQDDDVNRHDSLNWTAGMDFSYGPGSVFYVNLQYAGIWVMNYDASTSADYRNSLGVPQLASQDYMTRMAYRSLVQSLGLQTEQMLNSLTVDMKWPLADATVTPTLIGVVAVPYNYDTTVQTRYLSADLNPEIDWMPVDGFHLIAGADLAYAWVKVAGSNSISLDTTGDRIGVYTPQNNVYVAVDYNWNGSLGAQ